MTGLAREIAPLPPSAGTRLAADELPLAQRGLLDGRFTFIDGLRGIAALGVAAFHFYRMSRLSGPGWITWPTSVVLTHGDLGVSIFFVISGFVMAHSLRNAWISPKYLGNFVFRRSLRLDPPYWATIALAALAEWVWNRYSSGVGHVDFTWQKLWPHFLYLQDILGPNKDNSIVGVFWTLCLEVQFYLAFILCLCLVQQGLSRFERRRNATALLEAPTSPARRHRFEAAAMMVFMPLLLGSLVVQLVTVQGDLPKAHSRMGRAASAPRVSAFAAAPAKTSPLPEGRHSQHRGNQSGAQRPALDGHSGEMVAPAHPATRSTARGLSFSNWKRGFFLRYWYTFFLGVMVYWVLGRAVKIGWLLGSVIAIEIVEGLDWRDINALDHTAMVLATAGIIFAVGNAGELGRWFTNRVLQYLGRISYSLYLIHLVVGEPFMKWLMQVQPVSRSTSAWVSWFHFFAGLGVSIVAADVLYRLVERPAVKFSKRFKPRGSSAQPAEPVQADIVTQALAS